MTIAMKKSEFPSGWDERRVQELLNHYDHQTDEEAVAEHEAALSRLGYTLMEIPTDLVPAVREIIAEHERAGLGSKDETRQATSTPSRLLSTKPRQVQKEGATMASPPVRHDAPGMRGPRARTKKGPLERKRGDTHAGTVEKEYGIDLGVRSDKLLRNVLKDENVESLKELVRKKKSE